MLQRIQTIFLFFALIATVLMFFMPALEVESTSVLITNENFTVVAAMVAIIALITLITIFIYKKRTLQVRLCLYNMILMVAFYGSFYYMITDKVGDADYSFGIAAIMPAVSFILTFLAFRAIRRDDALIKSLDRIR